MEKEIWKDIKGYEGYYQVSNLGNIRTLERKIINNGKIMTRKARTTKQRKKGKYYCVTLSKNGIVKEYTVHRLVAQAFIPNPENKPCINHIIPVTDELCNNNVSNLEWATYSENNKYAFILGRNKSNFNTKGKFGKDSFHHRKIYQIDNKTGKIIKLFYGFLEASRETGINKGTIFSACKRKTILKGCKWQYADKQ